MKRRITMRGFSFKETNLDGHETTFRLEFQDERTDSAGRRHYALYWTRSDGKRRAQHFFAVPPKRGRN